MPTVPRIVALVLAFLLLAGGLVGLGLHSMVDDKRDALRKDLSRRSGWLRPVVEFATNQLEPTAVHISLLMLAGACVASAFWPGKEPVRPKQEEKKEKKKQSAPEPEPEEDSPSRREVKRLLKLASALEAEHGAEAAADMLLQEGLFEEAAEIFEREGLLERVAEVRHDQNRFEEAAATYAQAQKWESAGAIYQQIERYEDAAACYVKADKRSVAAEMFEKAENYREAGRCYRDIGFHRHAAQALLKGHCELEAAQSLVAAFEEEGGGSAATEQAARDTRSLAKKAGELFYKLERFEEAESILVRAGAFGAAGKVAFHTGAYDRAAEMFLRIGRGDLAAKALEKLDNPAAAAKALGEYLRDKGQAEEAVGHLERAGEYQEAADLYRRLSRFEASGECYWKIGDYEAAAEMFHAANALARAGEAYEKSGRFEQAAECFGQAGDALRRADLLEKAGKLFEAGQEYQKHGQIDAAIRVLQLVEASDPNFGEVCSVLGGLFQEKGMHSLSIKKFEEATQDQPVTRENVAPYYQLALAHEGRNEFEKPIEIYEKILAFDYHYGDVSERLDRAKASRASQPAPAPAGASGPQPANGRYQVVREIGRGGMGVVFLARDTVLEREVAFKVLPEQLRENPNALKNFLREAKAAAQLNHPNIVTVYDAGESEHGFYLAMELVEGTTLKEIVQRRGAVSPGGVLYILRQLADALAYAHAKKVVHRDIKTANTMWTPGRQVKIMDFGLAKLIEEVRNATTVVSGTPFYMSPEQTLGHNVDHRTDIYSLGVTLFELATGQLPFRRGNVPYHHVHTPPPEPRSINEKVPDGLEKIVLRCLQKAPEDRYQSAKELIEELDGLSLQEASS